MDLLFIISTFYQDLPLELADCLNLINNYFPKCIDTRYLASLAQLVYYARLLIISRKTMKYPISN